MEKLWTLIKKKNWPLRKKFRIASLIIGTPFAVAGILLWLIIRLWAGCSVEWLLCLIGYPYLISYFYVYFYSFNHDAVERRK